MSSRPKNIGMGAIDKQKKEFLRHHKKLFDPDFKGCCARKI